MVYDCLYFIIVSAINTAHYQRAFDVTWLKTSHYVYRGHTTNQYLNVEEKATKRKGKETPKKKRDV